MIWLSVSEQFLWSFHYRLFLFGATKFFCAYGLYKVHLLRHLSIRVDLLMCFTNFRKYQNESHHEICQISFPNQIGTQDVSSFIPHLFDSCCEELLCKNGWNLAGDIEGKKEEAMERWILRGKKNCRLPLHVLQINLSLSSQKIDRLLTIVATYVK